MCVQINDVDFVTRELHARSHVLVSLSRDAASASAPLISGTSRIISMLFGGTIRDPSMTQIRRSSRPCILSHFRPDYERLLYLPMQRRPSATCTAAATVNLVKKIFSAVGTFIVPVNEWPMEDLNPNP